MRLHTSVVEKLVHLFETYGGHKQETKLRAMLQEVDLSVYERESGENILVYSNDLEREQAAVAQASRRAY